MTREEWERRKLAIELMRPDNPMLPTMIELFRSQSEPVPHAQVQRKDS